MDKPKIAGTQPGWVCKACGDVYRVGEWKAMSTWRGGKCGVCQQPAVVTEPRDCGYLTEEWMEH